MRTRLIPALLVALAASQVASAEFLYLAHGDSIQRIRPDGSGLETIIANGPGYRALAVDSIGGALYFSTDSTLERASLSGANHETIISLPAFDIEIDPVAGKLYFARGSRSFYRANLDGSGLEEFDLSALGQNVDISALALDLVSQRIYFTETVADRIYRANLDGTGAQQIVQITASNSYLTELELDVLSGTLYWLDDVQNKMQRASTVDGQVSDMVVGTRGNRIAIDSINQWVYWSSPTDGISRIRFDGSGSAQVFASDQNIIGIDFGPDDSINPIPVPPSAILVLIACACASAARLRKRRKSGRPAGPESMVA